MKITKRQLRRIIKEELTRVLVEGGKDNPVAALVRYVANASTKEEEQLRIAKNDPAWKELSPAQQSEFEIALEEYNEKMMGF